jgi:hypothetical protein
MLASRTGAAQVDPPTQAASRPAKDGRRSRLESAGFGDHLRIRSMRTESEKQV